MKNPLNVQMEEISEFIHAAIVDEANHDHWQICKLTADKFNLWEDDKFPLWISYVVQGLLNSFN